MIKEEYVSWETAKLLKEAGFPQGGIIGYMTGPRKGKEPEAYAAPSQSLAMRWLREEHHISVEPAGCLDEQWCVNVWNFNSVEGIANDEVDRYPTYEAAAEAGIQAACKYLIKNKS